MRETTLFKARLFLVLSCLVASLGWAVPAAAEDFAGTYRGFLAFDYKGEEVREWMMITFHGDGTLIMGAEEGHDEPVDPETGLATRNDIESANLGAWRKAPGNSLEFGSEQMRAGYGFCAPVNKHPEGLLPTCSFVLTARLSKNAKVRGESCDLGGVGGGFSLQSANGQMVDANPFDLNMTIDYCLVKMTVDRFFELAPIN
jgi:hypothetical protein